LNHQTYSVIKLNLLNILRSNCCDDIFAAIQQKLPSTDVFTSGQEHKYVLQRHSTPYSVLPHAQTMSSHLSDYLQRYRKKNIKKILK